MKKKFLTIFFALVAALCLCFGLAACGEGAPKTPSDTTQTETGGGNNTPSDHVHAYGNWEVITPATHTTTGTRRKYCSCGDHIDETIPKTTEHTFLPYSHTDATCTEAGEDVLRCECGEEQHTTIPAEGHTYDKGVCSVCGSVEGLIAFRTLEVSDDDTVYGKVSNQTQTFSFIQEIIAADGVTFTVSFDLNGIESIPTKTVSLEIGDNTYYILVTRGNDLKLYTVTVRRRPVYNVSFETSGSAVSSQQVEEDQNIVQPAATARTGYTFRNWTLNGNAVTFPYKAEEGIPQTSTYNVTLNAVFTANEYKAALDAKGGEVSGNEQTVTYDESYNFPVPTRTGYTFLGWYEGENQLTNVEGASLSAWTYAEGKQIDARWSANSYLLTVEGNLPDAGTVTGGGTFAYDSDVTVTATTNRGYNFLGWYDEAGEQLSAEENYTFPMGLEQTITAKWDFYTVTVSRNDTAAGTVSQNYNEEKISAGEQITLSVKTTNLGYTFLGWYSGETELTTDKTYSFTMGRENVTFEARWKVSPEMENFIFTSDTTTCTLTSIKDNTVTEIIVPDYVTRIYGGAFKGCSRVESIVVPFVGGSVGAPYERNPFGYIFGTTEFSDTSAVKQDYVRLVPYGGGKKVETYTSTYYIPNSLKEVTITSGGIDIWAFENCSMLESVTIADNATFIGKSAFINCSSLKSIVIPANVTSIAEYVFNNCTMLEKVFWNAEECEEAGYYSSQYNYTIFQGCPNLKSVTFGETVKIIPAYAFWGCSGLKDIIIPDSVTSIGNYAFYGCSGLTGVYITDLAAWCAIDFGSLYENPLYYSHHLYLDGAEVKNLTIPAEITEIKPYAFYNCRGLESVTIGDGVTSIGSSAFENCSGLESVTIGSSVTSIGSSAFENCSGLTSITIPDSVTSIGDYAFYNCSGLESVIWNAENCTTAGSSSYPIFSGCTQLKTVTFGENVKIIPAYAFYNCRGLESIEIPNGVTSIGDYAFYNCNGLTGELKIPNGVTSIGSSAFQYCRGLESIEIPNGVTSIGSSAFEYCSGLTGVYITDLAAWCKIDFESSTANPLLYADHLYLDGDEVKDLTIPAEITEIKECAFYNCSGLTNITIPNGVTSIGSSAFLGCSGLKSIEIPDSVTSIGSYAFYNCGGLTSIKIPDSVTSIGSYAFFYCSVKAVYYKGTPSAWGGISIGGSNGSLTNATRYYFSAQAPSAEQWEESENWWHYEADGETIVLWTKEEV